VAKVGWDVVIDHVVIGVGDMPTSRAFYERALTPLGVSVVLDLPIYHQHYYGAFVFDPDGNNIEAVCHLPAGHTTSRSNVR
jgi:catechol 2,3-dioxygenase-like lactoylglutathione lyase family enzyme